MTTVEHAVRKLNATPAAFAIVMIRLLANHHEAHVPGSDFSVISVINLRADVNGEWSQSLIPNDEIAPAGTVYEIRERILGGDWRLSIISVPATGGPYDVEDLLVDAPGSLPAPATQAHIIDADAAHHASAIAVTPTGTISAENVQDALVEIAQEAIGGAGAIEFIQSSASDTWLIAHALGYFPNVTIVDSTDREVAGAVRYVDVDTVEVTFAAAFAGRAFLS